MLDLDRYQTKKEPLGLLSGYAAAVQVPATFLYGMPKPVPDIAMEDYTNKASGLAEEIRRRQENLRFVLKQFKKDFVKTITFDSMLNRKLTKEPYTSLMNVEILNPMGLRAPLLDYAKVVFEAVEISKLIVAKTLPNAKIFFAKLVADDELQNSRPLDVYQYLTLNTDHVTELKSQFAKMLDSQYENATSTFGQQFRRVKDWEETCKLVAEISKGVEDLTKYELSADVKEITSLLDKLALRVKRTDEGGISATNLQLVKSATRSIAEEVSFLGATLHLADTLVKVMEDNKEYLRDYLTK